MIKSFTFATALWAVATLMGCQQATIKQSAHTMVTYPFSDPNPVANPSASIYPYFRFDGYTTQGQEEEWTLIELENPYIRLSVMPGQGGKIWGAMEQSTGENFIYQNDVVKFRDIAMRGAWTSGGVEINFGLIGHAPWTATPVDYTVRENQDGSVSCFVGTLDLLTRAWWSCEIKLEKDKAYFTTQTKWYNPSPISQPYYHWMNAGYNQTDDMEFYFPGNRSIGHDGSVAPWPVDDQGRNLSRYAQNNFGSAKSYHITGDVASYYATYWPEKEFGSAHHSDFDDKLGMKIFLWGLSDEGMIWEDLLSDNEGQYVELQSGRLFNQEDQNSAHTPYKHFNHQPAATESFVEYWYPIKGTKGVTHTNRYATVNLERQDKGLMLYLSPLQPIDQTLVVSSGGQELYRKELKLKPMETFVDQIATQLPVEKLRVTLGDNLLVYDQQDQEQPLARPQSIAPGFDPSSLYGRYVMGCQKMNIKRYDEARALLGEALALDAHYAPALNALASIDYRQGRYEAAVAHAKTSLSIDTYDPQANLIYGAANAALGRSKDAIDGFSLAAYSPSTRTAAYIGLGKEYAKRGEWERVVGYGQKVLQSNGFNADGYQLIAVGQRHLGRKALANQAIETLKQEIPLNHFTRFEQYRMGQIAPQEVTDQITSELAHELLLEMGLWYESLGATDDALALYSLPGIKHPLLDYRKAYVEYRSGMNYEQSLEQAANASAHLVFPSRHEMLPLFQWADSIQNNWKNRYYLALTQWHLGDQAGALELMQSLGKTPDYAPFYLSRAQLKQGAERIEDLRQAEAIEQTWRGGLQLIAQYKAQNDKTNQLAVAEQYHTLFGNDFRLGMAYVPVLMDNGRYEEALKYLETVTIIPYEGAFEGRSMYRDCYLNLALQAIANKEYQRAIEQIEKSKIWIRNLGVGKPYDADIDNRTEEYLTAYCLEQMGQADRAKAHYQQVAKQTQWLNSNTVLSALALRKLGQANQAKALLTQYQQTNNNASVAEWAQHVYNGNRGAADRIIATQDLKGGLGAFGANNFKDYGFIAIVQKAVYL